MVPPIKILGNRKLEKKTQFSHFSGVLDYRSEQMARKHVFEQLYRSRILKFFRIPIFFWIHYIQDDNPE